MLVRYTGILVSLSHESAMRILSEVTRNSYDDQLAYDVTLDDRLHLHDRFTPFSPGPFGRVAVEAWKRIANIGLATLILEDLLHGFPFKVPETAKSLALEKVKDPWDIVKSPLITNAHLIAELWEAGSLDAGDVERMQRSPARLLEKRFESELPEICAAVARKRIQGQQPACTEPTDSQSFSESVVNSERSQWHGNPKWEFFYALHSAVEGGESFDKAFREKHRNLYEQYKRTEMSLAECIELVKMGETRESGERAATQRPESRALRFPRFRPFRRKEEAPAAVEESSAPESDLRISYTIHGMDTEWFQKWLGRLAEWEQRAINNRLKSAAAGNFGDYTRLRGAGKLWEFRFHGGAGQRLFFQFEGKNEIRLLEAGSKDEQDLKIDNLRRTL
jgi:putative addiction module killer protein